MSIRRLALIASLRSVLALVVSAVAMWSAGDARGQLCETAQEMSLDAWSQYSNEVVYPSVSTPCGTIQHAAYLRFTAPQSGQYQFSVNGTSHD